MIAEGAFHLRWRIEGRLALSSASVAHASPTSPAAASACPAEDLWAASSRGISAARSLLRSTAAMPPISMGSPKGVPVPCMCSAFTCGTARTLPS